MARIEHRGRRFLLGKYRGVVLNNEDPDALGRLRISVPSIWGKDVEHHAWAEPNFPSVEQFTVPPVGSQVWIEFEEGDLDSPIWTGCFLKSSEPHTEAKEGSPKARSWKTEEALRITLDDNVKEIVIQANDGTSITLKKDDEKIIIDAESIELGAGASEALVLGDAFQALFNAHTHPYTDDGSPAVTSPPSTPMTASELSSKHKVE